MRPPSRVPVQSCSKPEGNRTLTVVAGIQGEIEGFGVVQKRSECTNSHGNAFLSFCLAGRCQNK